MGNETDDPGPTKTCSKCGQKFLATIEFFCRDARQSNGLTKWCKLCRTIATKVWNKHNPKKVQAHNRQHHLKRKFGLTLDQYDQMFESQNGVCGICGKPDITGKYLYVDHNHETGKVRGLLCHRCNCGLGYFEDWVQEFRGQIIRYIKENE